MQPKHVPLFTNNPLTGQKPGDQLAGHWDQQEHPSDSQGRGDHNCGGKTLEQPLRETHAHTASEKRNHRNITEEGGAQLGQCGVLGETRKTTAVHAARLRVFLLVVRYIEFIYAFFFTETTPRQAPFQQGQKSAN